MDVNNIGQGSSINNMSYISELNLTKDKVIKEVENIDITNTNYDRNTNEYDKKDLDKAIKKLNKFLEDENVYAEYSVHDDFKNTVMIKIVNSSTKDIVMEVPPKKILDMIASMCKQVGLLDKKS